MPLTTIHVERVDSVDYDGRFGRFKAFCISGTTDEPGIFQVHTTNQWAAALCERVKGTKQAVDVLWKDARFGRLLVEVKTTEIVGAA